MSSVTIDDLRRWARAEFGTSRQEIAPREANTLIGLGLGFTEAQVLSRGNSRLSNEQLDDLRALIARRCAGVPFAYLAGRREFYGRNFKVDPRVLIPRPETEHLIDTVLQLTPSPQRVLDIGTGSGCIAITLALELPQITVTATDLEVRALSVAKSNRATHGLDASRVRLAAADLAHGIKLGSFDTVVSNPPYVATSDSLPKTVVDHEPHSALFAGASGLQIYQRLLGPETPLRTGQRLIMELGAQQQKEVALMAADHFSVETITADLAGWERVVSLQRR